MIGHPYQIELLTYVDDRTKDLIINAKDYTGNATPGWHGHRSGQKLKPKALQKKVDAIMKDVMADDKMVTGYKLTTLGDGLLVIDINNDRPITDIKHYGFDNDYKKSIMKKIMKAAPGNSSVPNVHFKVKVDTDLRPVSSQLKK